MIIPVDTLRRDAAEPVPDARAVTKSGHTGSRYARRSRYGTGLLAILALGIICTLLWQSAAPSPELADEASRQKSIAVLPFSNLSDDPDGRYFSEGLVEDLLNGFVKLDGLRVAARSSSFGLAEQDVRIIGSKLNVDTVLAGSVRKLGNRVRITAQLIDVADGFHLWSQSFDREADDLIAIQDEVSGAIVDALEVELLNHPVVHHRATSIEAHDLYFSGQHHWEERTAKSLQKAIVFFTRALQYDPGYALAYSGMADTYPLLNQYGDLPPPVALQEAGDTIDTALLTEPDPGGIRAQDSHAQRRWPAYY